MKGQMKIQQMAFMLMAIILFFVLVGLFYMTVKYTGLQRKASFLGQEEAIRLAGMLAESPEFSCGTNCIDADRMIVLKNRSIYANFWPVASIQIIKIYPTDRQEKECTPASYPNCNIFTIYQKKGVESQREAHSFVSICRREGKEEYVYNKCEIGKIIVGYEVKE